MDERVARLKSSQDARQLAENAQRLGNLEVSAQALERAKVLQANEEGFTTPAQIAIATALYAYEEEQSRIKHRTFRANHTRKMLTKHGPLKAAERMVVNRQPSKGFEILEEAGLQELSFEAIIDRYPEEFSQLAVDAARARLKGEALPSPLRTIPKQVLSRSKSSTKVGIPAVLDAEAQLFLNGFRAPDNRFMTGWLPRYRQTIQTIEKALTEDRSEDLFDMFWKTASSNIANAGQGLLKYDDVDEMRPELIQVILDIHSDSSPTNFTHIVDRFEAWKAKGRIAFVPRLLIARAFAGVHPRHYHTTVDNKSQNLALDWFVKHSGFHKPDSAKWGERAHALVVHLDQLKVFGDDFLARNIFPWFIVDQIREPRDIPAGHSPRSPTAYANIPPSQRILLLRHNTIQTALFELLVAEHGADNVWTEYPTGTGGYADAIVKQSGRCFLYEIKIADTAAEVVRQAMGQLLEYAFRKGGLEPTKLYVVGEPTLDDVTEKFISRLSNDFNLNIGYMRIVLPETATE